MFKCLGDEYRIRINMGKHAPKSKCIQEDEVNDYDSQIDELYRPCLIHCTTYSILTEQILTLMPSQRYVLLTMNEYDLSEINPMHPVTEDSPTHVIIFCIRFVADDIFQPIGGLLTYKHRDQSVILAECLKAYINDLWKLGLNVVGTVSPPFESFKGIFSHLVNVEDFNSYSNSLIYSVAPLKEIVHIYDIQFLLIKLQNLFKEGDIKFTEASREYRASWNDISLVLNISSEFKTLSNYLLDNKDVSRRVHIFTQQIFEQVLELEAQGVLSECAGGSAVLLNCIRSFLQFTEIDLVDLNLMCRIAGWDSLSGILPTMLFQKSQKRTCTKTKPTTIHVFTNPNIRRKIDFQLSENPDIINQLTEDMGDLVMLEEMENFENECEITKNQNDGRNISNEKSVKKSGGKNNKQRKSKRKNSKDEVLNEVISSFVDQAVTTKSDKNSNQKLHARKPYDKHTTEKTISKKSNTSADDKTDFDNITKDTVKETNSTEVNYNIEDNIGNKTEKFVESVTTEKDDQEKTDNKKSINCDIDKNNNSNEIIQSRNNFKNKSTTLAKCDKQTKNKKRDMEKFNEEDFDFVVNDAQKFFESFFVGFDVPTDSFVSTDNGALAKKYPTTMEKPLSDDYVEMKGGGPLHLNSLTSNNENIANENYNEFCSQTDEETENCVTEICDKVPTIVDSLSNEEDTQNSCTEFEQNNITSELLCTVFGMRKLMENLVTRRVKVAKPDAFVVEHIDFFVTIIKRDKNKINPVYYYGHNYEFLNSELAFATLQNNTGLFLVKT